jgi:membrane protease YdiL (CAAX protease family)
LGTVAAALIGEGMAGGAAALHRVSPTISRALLHHVELIERSGPVLGVAMALALGIGPGVGEELVFRGFVLRGLLAR